MKKSNLFNIIIAASSMALSLPSCASSAGFTFEGKTLEAAKVGVSYSADISVGDSEIYYEIDYDSDLPLGLELSSEGIISGTPSQDGNYSFVIIAVKGEKFLSANFTMQIEAGELSYEGGALPKGKTGEPYVRSVATATGSSKIQYQLKTGSPLPSGLELSSGGEISGTPETSGDFAFAIVASAEGCASKEATFTLTIEEGKEVIDNLGYIVFDGATLPSGLVGKEYYQSLATAYGVKNISYKVKYVGGIGYPKGLTFKNGILSGTPKDSTYGSLHFQVIASADGYDSVTADFYIQILDLEVETTRFEAEYTYVDNLVGAGYSGSNSGKNMIQSFANASNGRVIGYLNAAVTITFNITCSVDTTSSLSMTLGTENGTMTLDQSTFKVTVNDANIDYGGITVNEDGSNQDTKFHDYSVSSSINLKQGENTLLFSVLKVADGEGTSSARGPLFDKIDLKPTSGKTSWRPKVANLN